jgi:hypothetical protein
MTEVPVFHIPIGRTRGQDGEIVPFVRIPVIMNGQTVPS